MEKKKPETIDDYIDQYEGEVRERLIDLRRALKEAIPEAAEKISWQMPTYHHRGNVIHFAVSKNHIGVYPGAKAVEVFQEELKGYPSSKGTIRIPNDRVMPMETLQRIARFSLEENVQRDEEKRKKKREGKKKPTD